MKHSRENGWLGVEVRHLMALVTVARERSFSGAAERLGYAQSAVSQQIARLEQSVGMRLVDRTSGRGPIQLTNAGIVAYDHAERIMAQLMAARADLVALRDQEGETLTVGASQSISTQVVPGVLRRLRDSHSNLRVVTSEVPQDGELFSKVQEGVIDAAFTELPLPDDRLDHCELFEDPCVLLVQAGSELARGSEPISLETIAALPLVEQPTWRMTPRIEAEFRARGLELRYEVRSTTDRTLHALVAAGLAAAIVPRLSVDEHDPRVQAVPLDDPIPSRTLALVWHRDRRDNPSLSAFREVVLAICAERFGTPSPS